MENLAKRGVTTYAELGDHAARLATDLVARGVAPGDRVVVMMPNSPEVTGAFHAVWRIGAVIVPVTPQLATDEIRHLIVSSGAQVVLTCPALVDRLISLGLELPEEAFADI